MPGLTNAESQATLDARFPTTGAGDHIGYSTNGTSEFAGLARTPIGPTGWAAATAGDPSVKANANVLQSAGATVAAGGAGVTHFAIFTSLSGGTQRTEWQALTDARVLAIGDKIDWAIGACRVTCT